MTPARTDPTLPYPLKLAPRFLEKPWGGRRIETVLGRELPPDVPIGESWEVYDRDGGASTILNGLHAGKPLSDVRGDTPFPLLFKILDASRALSVQVHPDAEAAAQVGGEAKSECWFVLHATPGAKVYKGLEPGVSEEDFRAALAAGTVQDCLHAIEVDSGDTVFVPAGTVHAVGEGVLLAEIQQNSDTTYRLHDWGRAGLDGKPRELHTEQALRCTRFDVRGDDKVPAQLVEDEGSFRRVLLVRTRWFAAEHFTAMGTFTLEAEPSPATPFSILHVLGGAGELCPFRRGVEPVPFAPGDTILLPGDYDAYEVAAGATIFRALLLRG